MASRVYKFEAGQVTPERFIKIAPQVLAEGKEVAFGLRRHRRNRAAVSSWVAVFRERRATGCSLPIIFRTMSWLLDVSSGEIEKSFDLSRSRYVPAAYPYTVIANKAERRLG